MDGRSRPFFYGLDQTLNFQQKEALAQGILQVVETIPEGFEAFEFEFTGHRVHIYKLAHRIILLVLTRDDLIDADYLKTIKNLKAVLQEDITSAIASFRLFAGKLTVSGNSDRTTIPKATKSLNATTTYASSLPVEPAQTTTADSTSRSAPAAINASELNNSLKDTLLALNGLSQFTTRYLGTQVIVNYWKSTRPKIDWLNQFQVDRSAQISLPEMAPPTLQQPLSQQEQQWIRDWVAAFIKRCSLVIRDFRPIVEQNALTDQQKALLLG